MGNFSVIDADNGKAKWLDILKQFPRSDIFFHPDYSLIFEKNKDGKALCAIYEEDGHYILYPFLKRRVNDLPFMKNENTEYYDTITPYGYGGHLCSFSDKEKKMQMFTVFFKNFSDYAKKENIICEFIRFHPLLETQNNNTHFLNIKEWTKTIYIDLDKTLDVLWKEIRRDHKYRIKKAKKEGVELVIDEKLDKYDTFTNLYIQTMKRKAANKYYFFAASFFQDTKTFLSNNLILIHAKFEGKIIGSSLFMISPPFMHYHLSSTDDEYLYLSPNTCLLHKAIEWGKEKGLSYLHLGGGLKPDDSLYAYKHGFSKTNKTWYLGNKIYNDEAYRYISSKWECFYSEKFNENDSLNFFPIYRKAS